MGSMAVILASHAAPVAQTQALLLFNVVAFTVAELPLISYLAAPEKTRAFMADKKQQVEAYIYVKN